MEGEFFEENKIMKKFILGTLLLTLVFSVLAACDGNQNLTPAKQSFWSSSTVGTQTAAYECVNVADIEDYVYTGEPTEPTDETEPAEEEKTEGDVTTPTTPAPAAAAGSKTVLPSVAFKCFFGQCGDDAGNDEDTTKEENEAMTEQIIDCVNNEVKLVADTGSKFYWGNRTWILIRESKLYSKPVTAAVKNIEFTTCDQVKQAKCLLISNLK